MPWRRMRGVPGFHWSRPDGFEPGCEAKTTSLSRPALHPNRASHQADQPRGDGQHQPGAAKSARHRAIRLRERLENTALFFEWNADSGVTHRKFHDQTIQLSGQDGGMHRDRSLLGELDGIAK